LTRFAGPFDLGSKFVSRMVLDCAQSVDVGLLTGGRTEARFLSLRLRARHRRPLINYCTHVLHLSEHAAYGRIEAVRAAGKFPVILDQLADGAVTLTTICLLAPLLTAENHGALLASARHKSRREVEQLVAETRPKPDFPSVVRRLPSQRDCTATVPSILDGCAVAPSVLQPDDRSPSQHAAAPQVRPTNHPAVTVPLASDRYKIQFTASRDAYEKLCRAQALLRHVIPNGDPAAVFERALDVLLAGLERRKLAATSRPTGAREVAEGSRHMPAAVRREVWRRDGARCAFVGVAGRCAERGFLEFHHVVPFARGGKATVGNTELRCRAHNAYEAELAFGSFVVREYPAEYNPVRTEFDVGTTFVPNSGSVPCCGNHVADYTSRTALMP
jgi:hypothetical protein